MKLPVFQGKPIGRVASGKGSIFHPLLDAPPHILGDGGAFLLSGHGQQGELHLPQHLSGVDALFLKNNDHAQVFQLARGLDEFQGVAGEPGNGLHQDAGDLPGPAVRQHPFELVSFFQAGAGNALVRVNIRQLPARVLGDEVGVVANLGAAGVKLILGVGGHPAVCRHLFQCIALRLIWLNDLHLGHFLSPPPRTLPESGVEVHTQCG